MSAEIHEFAGAWTPAAGPPGAVLEDYAAARHRFVTAARVAGFALESYSIGQKGPNNEDLTIDVARRPAQTGAAAPDAVLFSSGLHGVEGPFGSAVQSAFFDAFGRDGTLRAWADRVSLTLIHALNPFGFAYQRRWNEDGVDLNRNFFRPGQDYTGAHALYGALCRYVNPRSRPRRPDIFPLVALYMIQRYGMTALREAIPTGQYTTPEGLFYGGRAASATVRVLDAQLPGWIGGALAARHLDFHTGLGPWATHKLIADFEPPCAADPAARDAALRAIAARLAALADRYGADAIDAPATEGVSYPARGAFKAWVDARFPGVRYDLLTAEFGTYPGPTVLRRLRAENRAWRFCVWGDRVDRRVRDALVEAFVPRDPVWRRKVVADGLALCYAALKPT